MTPARDERRALIDETRAETRNLLAELRALINRTLPEAPERAKLVARVEALARVQRLLADRDQATADFVDLNTLVESELAAQGAGPERISIQGPPVRLPGASVKVLAAALHELATNATAHGALAHAQGRLAIRWQVAEAAGERRLAIHWNESGVPLAAGVEALRGYGREVLDEALPFALRARTRLEVGADGFDWLIDLPLADG